jgi:hypothetical protein
VSELVFIVSSDSNVAADSVLLVEWVKSQAADINPRFKATEISLSKLVVWTVSDELLEDDCTDDESVYSRVVDCAHWVLVAAAALASASVVIWPG